MDFNNTSDFVGSWMEDLYHRHCAGQHRGLRGISLVRKARPRSRQARRPVIVWDEDLEEYNNPLPNWWRWMFYLTIAFSLVIFGLYPGLGTREGHGRWTMRRAV